jgi:hypothetical protein
VSLVDFENPRDTPHGGPEQCHSKCREVTFYENLHFFFFVEIVYLSETWVFGGDFITKRKKNFSSFDLAIIHGKRTKRWTTKLKTKKREFRKKKKKKIAADCIEIVPPAPKG